MFTIEINDPRPWYKQVVSGVLKTIWGFVLVCFWLFCLAIVAMIGATVYTFHTEILAFFVESWWMILTGFGVFISVFLAIGLYDWAVEVPEDDDEWEHL